MGGIYRQKEVEDGEGEEKNRRICKQRGGEDGSGREEWRTRKYVGRINEKRKGKEEECVGAKKG